LALVDERVDHALGERAAVLLPELELHFEATVGCKGDDLRRIESERRESLRTFDTRRADVRAEVQVLVEDSLLVCHLEWPAARDDRHAVTACARDFPPRCLFRADDPGRHRDLQARDQMRALLDVRFDGSGVVAGIERRRPWRQRRDAEARQVVDGAHRRRGAVGVVRVEKVIAAMAAGNRSPSVAA
jgi:hypothetical protein